MSEPKSMGEYLALPEAEKMRLAALPRVRKGKTMTGKCVKCDKILALGIDGSCKNCNAEICWDCWVASGHECPSCGDFDGKRDAANSHKETP